MKKKALICTVVIAAVVVIICALKLRQPDPTLFDKAMELEPGQLIGTDGSIWQTKESDGTARIVKTGKLKGNVPELDFQGKYPLICCPTSSPCPFRRKAAYIWITQGVCGR